MEYLGFIAAFVAGLSLYLTHKSRHHYLIAQKEMMKSRNDYIDAVNNAMEVEHIFSKRLKKMSSLVIILVEGGVVQDVVSSPYSVAYRVIDLDNLDAMEDDDKATMIRSWLEGIDDDDRTIVVDPVVYTREAVA